MRVGWMSSQQPRPGENEWTEPSLRVERVMWTSPPITNTRYEPQGIAKKKL